MPTTPSQPQPTDDAFYFMNESASNVNLFDASEDPTGGKNAPNALPDFNHRTKPSSHTMPVRCLPTSLQPVRARGRQL